MQFELKVQAPKNAPVVWNYDELKANLETALADFQNRVYTEDMLTDAKADRAKLNKLRDAIKAERISREKEYMQPFIEFKNQANELCELIDKASAGIKEQLDTFEEKRLAEKTEAIRVLYDDIVSNYDLPFLTLEKILNDKWLNKTTSDKAIAGEITEICEKIIKDMEVIKRLPDYSFEATEAYKATLDLNKALEEGERISKIAEQKKIVEAETMKETAKTDDTFEVKFKANLTVEQAKALAKFCQDNGIKLEKI